MPPWGAVKGFGSFAGDRGLSQDEIGLIADWVEGGAPEGDRNYLPKLKINAVNAGPGGATKLQERVLPAGAAAQKITIAGIAPRGAVKPGTQVVAELPDGSTEPLIWILEPKAAVAREFLFKQPLVLPAGTRFTVSQAGGQWKLLVAGAAN